ncbi:hypothetical protein CYMTET_52337 [Cymbomonas tetramitiformis]|uniref:Uncharacterized protein n=1 Tax=Cymbomonas tetramitiformis TaxID=36881 RepID=A0AAE0ER72_9CHLO|nr:hypothetical protein CYMTET_52337 [Cymbomonas tetramitiformis]
MGCAHPASPQRQWLCSSDVSTMGAAEAGDAGEALAARSAAVQETSVQIWTLPEVMEVIATLAGPTAASAAMATVKRAEKSGLEVEVGTQEGWAESVGLQWGVAEELAREEPEVMARVKADMGRTGAMAAFAAAVETWWQRQEEARDLLGMGTRREDEEGKEL